MKPDKKDWKRIGISFTLFSVGILFSFEIMNRMGIYCGWLLTFLLIGLVVIFMLVVIKIPKLWSSFSNVIEYILTQ